MTKSTEPKRTWPLGASRLGDGDWAFSVWAPDATRVTARIEDPDRHDLVLQPAGRGYHCGWIRGLAHEPTYRFVLDGGKAYADPASRHQPEGVHGPSRGFDPSLHVWHHDGFVPPAEHDLVIYEMHVGTFTEDGTFDAAAKHLDELTDLGINAIEPMPVAAFPGRRNWGYDGVFPFAVHEGYGGPAALQRFVDTCHGHGLAVILDVVYNHLGPEGAVHQHFAPYLTDTYATPWGAAMNFSEQGSDEVRRYFIDNALMWLRDFHVDGLRFDAIHGIVDPTASPFLRELTAAIGELSHLLGRKYLTIAESGDNNPLVISSPEVGGYGFDMQWNDDFHHALHALLTGERDGYYQDFGELTQLASAYTHGFVFRGEYSRFRGRRHGSQAPNAAAHRLVGFAQNHDQVGNRAGAERLVSLVGQRKAQLATAAVLLSPNVPMLFMGEEYAETAPFPYFVDHGDPGLLDAVRRGRAAEFGRDADQFDPAARETFDRARLDRGRRDSPQGAAMLDLVRRLLAVRRGLPLVNDPDADESLGYVEGPAVVVYRRLGTVESAVTLNFSDTATDVALAGGSTWRRLLDSTEFAPDEGEPTPGLVLAGGRVPLAPWGFAVCWGEPVATGRA
ncbi:MAG TPA: malto-oligosyltrehalose trehalohydrolase [Mycobacteriales bacterium]|nr:malto-oligosyltrehalose trehalohydrolase [Mycobacteriales bacterium]